MQVSWIGSFKDVSRKFPKCFKEEMDVMIREEEERLTSLNSVSCASKSTAMSNQEAEDLQQRDSTKEAHKLSCQAQWTIISP